MDYLVSILVILAILMLVVIYQSRYDKPSIKIYLQRFVKLLLLIFNYFKEVGVCAGKNFRQIDWDLTTVRPSIEVSTGTAITDEGANATVSNESVEPELPDISSEIQVPELDEPTVESFKAYRARKMKKRVKIKEPMAYNA